MSFNYGREERKWRLWKEAEENKLRSLGVDEDTIENLHNHDWEVFNSDRKYYRRLQDAGTYLEELPTEIEQPEINTVLIRVDKLTLQIVVMRLQGYKLYEIAPIVNLSEQAVYKRMQRLKKKIKKVLK